ncbi:MAG TPA: ATP-binding protein [Armatimonadota bacterium]|nr:ATP-binding protein [Armatimonadota bacterium]
MGPTAEKALVLSVAAGKGGTGKTLLATSLAIVAHDRGPRPVTLIDCDVEEPNAHLLLHPAWEDQELVTVGVPEVDADRCISCGRCAAACHTGAIALIRDRVLVFPDLCSSCGVCSYVCPVSAITEKAHSVGLVATGRSAEGIRIVSGMLDVGRARTGPVIDAARAKCLPDHVTIIDAPPGNACSMQDSVENSDVCLLVTEPTPFGCSDLALAIETCREMNVPCAVVVNRDGLGSARVEDVCDPLGVPILLRIPHSRAIASAYAGGRTLVDALPEWRDPLTGLLDGLAALVTRVGGGPPDNCSPARVDRPRVTVQSREGSGMQRDSQQSEGGSAGNAQFFGAGAGGGGGAGRGLGGGAGRGGGRGAGGGGRGGRGGGAGMGPGGQCVCPRCGATAPHVRGTPCTSIACPKCGSPMVRQGL